MTKKYFRGSSEKILGREGVSSGKIVIKSTPHIFRVFSVPIKALNKPLLGSRDQNYSMMQARCQQNVIHKLHFLMSQSGSKTLATVISSTNLSNPSVSISKASGIARYSRNQCQTMSNAEAVVDSSLILMSKPQQEDVKCSFLVNMNFIQYSIRSPLPVPNPLFTHSKPQEFLGIQKLSVGIPTTCRFFFSCFINQQNKLEHASHG